MTALFFDCDTRRVSQCATGLPMKFVKAVLKTRAVQTLRDCRTPSNRAKRLDCGAFTAALDLAHGAEQSFAGFAG